MQEQLIKELEDIHFPTLIYYYQLYKSSNISFKKCAYNSIYFLRPNLIDYYNIIISFSDNTENELLNIEELQILSIPELKSYTSKIIKEIKYCYLHIQKYRLYNGLWRIEGEF